MGDKIFVFLNLYIFKYLGLYVSTIKFQKDVYKEIKETVEYNQHLIETIMEIADYTEDLETILEIQ